MNNIEDNRQTNYWRLDNVCLLRLTTCLRLSTWDGTCQRLSTTGYFIIQMNNREYNRQTDHWRLNSGCLLRLTTCPRLSTRGWTCQRPNTIGYFIIPMNNIEDNRQTDHWRLDNGCHSRLTRGSLDVLDRKGLWLLHDWKVLSAIRRCWDDSCIRKIFY